MSQCPLCSSPIEDSFGLIECPGCHKILFADFDGTLKVHDENSESPLSNDIPKKASEPEDEDSNGWDLDRKTHALSNLDPELEPELDPELEPELEPESESLSAPAVESVAASSADFDPFQVEEAIIEEVFEDPVVDSDFPLSAIDEINQFASSEASSLKQGMLIYNLTIKNIDTEDLKQEILEILKENKLNIDTKKLKFAIPTLELKDLNPVKVSVIVSKIKHLPVEVEWVQKSAIINEENGID